MSIVNSLPLSEANKNSIQGKAAFLFGIGNTQKIQRPNAHP